MGPFHRMVLQSDSAFLISSLLSGPTSRPCGAAAAAAAQAGRGGTQEAAVSQPEPAGAAAAAAPARVPCAAIQQAGGGTPHLAAAATAQQQQQQQARPQACPSSPSASWLTHHPAIGDCGDGHHLGLGIRRELVRNNHVGGQHKLHAPLLQQAGRQAGRRRAVKQGGREAGRQAGCRAPPA